MIDTLITGGSGYIGQQLIKKMNKKTIRVVSRKKIINLNTVVCDLENEDIPDSYFKDINTVYHLAAITHDTSANKNNQKYYKVNVQATKQLLLKCIKFKVKHFIFLSSSMASAVISNKDTLNETDVSEPIDVYGKSKKDAENLVISLLKNTNIHYVILRPTLVYGQQLKGNLKLIHQLTKFRIFPPIPETFNKKTLIHVSDLVDAILFVKKNKKCCGHIFIVTDGYYYSTKSIYIAILNSLGRSVPEWQVPIVLFNILGKVHSKLQFMLNKMFGSNPYNSDKLKSYGFSAQKKFTNIL